MDHVQSGIHEVICDLPKEVIEAVLNESNSSLNQEPRGLNLIKSDSSTKGVKSNNEEVNEKGESRKEEKKELDEEMIEDGSKQTEEKEGRKKVMKSSFERLLSLSFSFISLPFSFVLFAFSFVLSPTFLINVGVY